MPICSSAISSAVCCISNFPLIASGPVLLKNPFSFSTLKLMIFPGFEMIPLYSFISLLCEISCGTSSLSAGSSGFSCVKMNDLSFNVPVKYE